MSLNIDYLKPEFLIITERSRSPQFKDRMRASDLDNVSAVHSADTPTLTSTKALLPIYQSKENF